MTIIVNPSGGFGNVLSFYAIGFILAEKFNTKIKINWHCSEDELDLKKKDTRLCLKKILNDEYITNETENRSTILLSNYEQLIDILKVDTIDYNIEIDRLLSDIHKLYETIHHPNKFILLNKIINPINLKENDIVFSFRIGMGNSEVSPEAYELYHKLPFYYYENAVKELNLKKSRFIICSDNFTSRFEEQIIKELDKFENQKIYCNFDTLTQFKILCDAQYLIASNSTFSIWASMFTNAKRIIYPKYKISGDMFFDRNNSEKLYPKKQNISLIEI